MTNKNTTVQLLVLFTSSNPWDRAEESDATFTQLVLPLDEPSEESQGDWPNNQRASEEIIRRCTVARLKNVPKPLVCVCACVHALSFACV